MSQKIQYVYFLTKYICEIWSLGVGNTCILYIYRKGGG